MALYGIFPGVIYMKNSIKGSAYILIATIIWGSAFVAQSVGMDHIGPFTFQAVRCGLAAIGLLPFIYFADKKQGKSFLQQWKNKRLWLAGCLCAIPFFLAANLQQIGLVTTDAGKSGFLTAMYIVIVPIIGLFRGKKFTVMIPISVALAVAGLYLLSCAGIGKIKIGDICLIGCALAFALQITVVDIFANDVDAMRLNCLQAGLGAIATAVVVAFTETPTLQGIWDCALPLCYTGFLSMGLAYTLQILGQRHLESATASLLMSLEAAFAVLTGWLILGERLNRNESIGCLLMFSAVIISQIPIKEKSAP